MRQNVDDDDDPQPLLANDEPTLNVHSSPTLIRSSISTNDVEQHEGILGKTEDDTDARPVSEPIPWPEAIEPTDRWYDEHIATEYSSIESSFVPFVGSMKWVVTARRLAASLGIGIFLLCILFAISQTAAMVTSVSVLPSVLKFVCYASLVILWVAVLIAIATAVTSFFRLKISPRVSISALEVMNQRNTARELGNLTRAKQGIREFLESFPKRDDKSHSKLLAECSVGEMLGNDGLSRFYVNIDQLLKDVDGDTTQWIKRAKSDIFEHLDLAADNFIRQSSIKVGIKTAISPRGVIDSLIVLAHSWILVGKLCRLYNLRPNAWESCIILGFTGFNAIASDRSDEVAGTLQKEIAENSASYIGDIAANVIAIVASRAAEGSVNAVLIYRLGKQLKSYLRVVSQ